MLTLSHITYRVKDSDTAGAGKETEILSDINLDLNERFVAITGPNGSGKSTLARLIAGIIRPTEGRILLDGQDITDMSVTDRARAGISYAFQQPVRFKGLTVRDLLTLAAGKPLSMGEACEYLSEVGLCAKEYVNREVNASLSGGELKRMEIAMILARGTKFSVFDEPEAGIDLWSFQNLIGVFRNMYEQTHGTILIISHQERILDIADRVIVLSGGHVTAALLHRERRRTMAEFKGLDAIQKQLLEEVSGLHEMPEGAYSLRINGALFGKNSSAHIRIEKKTDVAGIDIYIEPGTKNESVHIPVLLAQTGLKELVYNDFHIGEDCDVTIVAGCGIHNGGAETSEHSGIHRFWIGERARVRYVEKHYGEGEGTGERVMNPTTEVHLAADSYMEMETAQIKGVDSTRRETDAELDDRATLVIHEKIMTHGAQRAETHFRVDLNGAGCGTHVVSRSVARDTSHQLFISDVRGNNRCSGHTECDAIIMDAASVTAKPEIAANHVEASLIHEAAIGKIAGEQLTKLMTLGLTEKEAEEQIINGFLK